MNSLITIRIVWGPLLVVAVVLALVWAALSSWMLFLVCLPLIWLVCGWLDVLRSRPLSLYMLKKYFTSKGGLITWVLAPLNLILDAFATPSLKIYQLCDYPDAWRAEIDQVLSIIEHHKSDIIKLIQSEGTGDKQRSMYLAKWYGINMDDMIDDFHQPFRYIKTIGVSTFSAGATTGWHFGPLRMTYRILYNLEPCDNKECFITSMNITHYWKDSPFFSFDDTLMHKSVNGSNANRYCAYIDIIRPTPWMPLYNLMISAIQRGFQGASPAFYRKWKIIS